MINRLCNQRGLTIAIKLTPSRLRQIVLQEKKKIETAKEMDKKALKDLQMEMDEESWHDAKPPAAKKYGPGDKPMGAGATMKEMRDLREQEEMLRNRLRKLQERRIALRRKVISQLD